MADPGSNDTKVDPMWMTIEEQCTLVLECIKENMDPDEILKSKFNNDSFVFELAISLLAKKGLISKDKKTDRWHISKPSSIGRRISSFTSAITD